MRAVEVIEAKRRGEAHSRDVLYTFVADYVAGRVPDYQVAAWLMAVCFRGLDADETTALTLAMAHSGDVLDLSSLPHTADKHSTGGVGDKTSLVLAPLLAACGATVAKMSGRGLGHTGGTVDKLESIPGFRAALSERAFYAQAEAVGVVITGQSKDLAPADGLFYALRDATATVASLPLIAASIMSKKLAGGAQTIVLDVKVGSGAFMKTPDEARALAATMLGIGVRAGRNVRALLSDMSEPLGQTVGNTLEVEEAVRCLQGDGPDDLRELCLTLAEEAVAAAGLGVGRQGLEAALSSGRAFEVFERWIAAQGAHPDALAKLERAPGQRLYRADEGGFVSGLEALALGQAVKVLGGGRAYKGAPIDVGVGAVLHAKVGDEVRRGEPLVTLYHRDGRGLDEALGWLRGAVTLAPTRLEPPPLVRERVR
jgi:pyrimidine-nucleoside phosphorylase/thymidine phosphorylase